MPVTTLDPATEPILVGRRAIAGRPSARPADDRAACAADAVLAWPEAGA